MTLNIPIEDFIKNTSDIFGIQDKLVCQLYHFFKNRTPSTISPETHPANFTYELLGDCSQFSEAEKRILNSYGIITDIFIEGFSEQLLFVIIPEYALNSKEALSAYWEIYNYRNLRPGYCVIERDFTHDNNYHEIFNMVNDVVQNCTIMNKKPLSEHTLLTAEKALGNIIKSTCYETQTKFEIINLTNDFTGIGEASSISAYVDNALALISKIISLNLDKNQIIAVKGLSNADKHAYLVIAAYLLLTHNIRFQIEPADRAEFIDIVRSTRESRYLFCDEFLYNLQHFPDISISQTTNKCFVYAKDYGTLKNSGSKYVPTLTMYRAPIKDFELLQDFNKQSLVIKLDQLHGIKRIRELCDIGSSNYEDAYKALTVLDKFTRQCMRSLLKQRIIMDGSKIAMNNMLIYEQGGTYYVGYIVNVDTKMPFYVYPMMGGYNPFRAELNLQQLSRLLDTRIFYDSKILCDKIVSKAGDSYGGLDFRYDMNTLRGIILQGYRNSKQQFKENSKLTIAEIGVWSRQTSLSRADGVDTFASIFSRQALLETENFYSFFGLLHPSVSTQLYIHDKYWRGL